MKTKGTSVLATAQRSQGDAAPASFLFTPKAGAAMTSKFDGVFFFSFSSFFLPIFFSLQRY